MLLFFLLRNIWICLTNKYWNILQKIFLDRYYLWQIPELFNVFINKSQAKWYAPWDSIFKNFISFFKNKKRNPWLYLCPIFFIKKYGNILKEFSTAMTHLMVLGIMFSWFMRHIFLFFDRRPYDTKIYFSWTIMKDILAAFFIPISCQKWYKVDKV